MKIAIKKLKINFKSMSNERNDTIPTRAKMLFFRNNKNVMEQNDLKVFEAVLWVVAPHINFFSCTSVSGKHTSSFFRATRERSGHGDWPVIAMG